jgi:hypothetical protein
MTYDKYSHFISALGDYIKDDVEDTVKEAEKSRKKMKNRAREPFYEGYCVALYDFISLMIEKAKADNIPLSALSFEGFDPAKELLSVSSE